ncbi:MAG: hypothetical protein EXQ77_01885 [Thermoleophilia bacterium]|nr:hypothetical protein [Thermoleophilia bacterium]
MVVPWRREADPRRFLQASAASLAILALVTVSGAFVRLTGSGLGCENWPRCGDTPLPARDFHALVEFGNRVVALVGILAALATWLVARRVPGLPRRVRLTAFGAVLGTLAQIPLGGVTVLLDLHPVAVMSHFFLAFVVLALAVFTVREARDRTRGLVRRPAPRAERAAAALLGLACVVAIVTGAVATASGPHPGSDLQVERLGLGIEGTVYVHVRATAVFGIALALLAVSAWRRRHAAPDALRLLCALLCALVVQMAVGEIQYRNALPWGLVLAHVALASGIWLLTVAFAHAAWRRPVDALAPAATTLPT